LTRLKDVIQKQLPTVLVGTSLNQALLVMSEGRLGLVLVMDGAGEMKGLFTDGDLRRALIKSKSSLDDLDDHYMSLSPLNVTG